MARKIYAAGVIEKREADAIAGRDICKSQGKLKSMTINSEATPSDGGALNPDWEEWLMFWPIGWTDLDTPNHRLVWYHPTFDPAAVTCEASAALPFIPRLTTRRKHRVARVKEIGNGQYPPTAFLAQEWGFALLLSFERSGI